MGYIGQTPSAVPLDGSDIADDIVDSQHYAAGSIDTAHLADDQITLAKMAAGTDGNIISYDASGNPVAIATGSDGQVLTSAGAGAAPAFEALPASGKVLQVLNAVKTDTSSINSTTYADISGLSLAITPSATTSKILFTMNVSIGCAADANHVHLNMVRGSTNILVSGSAGSRSVSTALVNTQGVGQQITATATYLDSPSTTSATTYKIQWKNNGSAASYVNQSTRDNNASGNDGRVTSQITLMEIGA